MSGSNVIQFAPALQRRRYHAALAMSDGSWLSRYPEGIDGLWADSHTWTLPGVVIHFPQQG